MSQWRARGTRAFGYLRIHTHAYLRTYIGTYIEFRPDTHMEVDIDGSRYRHV